MNEAIESPDSEVGTPTGTDSGESGWSNEQVEALRQALPEGMKPEGVAKTLKELQSSKDQHLTALKNVGDAFNPYGGPEQALQMLNNISGDEKVLAAIQDAKSNKTDVDEDTRAALDLVEKELGPKQQLAIKKELAPIQNALKAQELEKAKGRLNEKFGDNWKELEGAAAQLLRDRGFQQGFATADDIMGAFGEAAFRTGKFDVLSDAVNQKKLEAAKKTDVDTPKVSQKEVIPQHAKTLEDALKIAKKQHKIEGELSF